MIGNSGIFSLNTVALNWSAYCGLHVTISVLKICIQSSSLLVGVKNIV